ncbi:MAG: protein kinase [Gammaproteobacteria bacterium]
MKILIIDDSPDFRALARHYLNKEIEQPEIEEYDVEKLGRPGDDFDWGRYDVLLLDYKLGDNEDGLEWLKTFRGRPGFPPTIILTAEGDEYVAIRSVKLGAADYINKKDVSPKRLKQIVEEAASFNDEKIAAQDAIIKEDTRILRNIRRSHQPSTEQGLEIGYRFVRIIGQGGMSHVYLAERVSDRKSVVLKIIDLSSIRDETLVRRFIQEAEMIAGLRSPFVVRIFEHGMTDDYGYIAMEFFSRGDLKQRMELAIPPDVAFNYMTHITYGLDAVHSIGVIHRDLKPANIMFRGDDSLALADFGISKKLEGASDLTTVGQILGTPHYMSPEQGEGKPLDFRSDLYSAGVLLFELLAGEKPYSGHTAAALIYQHVHADIPRLPKELDHYQDVIDRALAKNPDDRYQTARELIFDLESAERDFQ